MNYRDLAERAIWTAVQAFLAVFLAADFGTFQEAKSAAAAGVVALVSAVLSLVKNVARQKLGPQPEPVPVEPLPSVEESVSEDRLSVSTDFPPEDPNTELFQGE